MSDHDQSTPAVSERPGRGFQVDGLEPTLAADGYREQEWTLRGFVGGEAFETIVITRRPVDPAAFSGTVVVEPMHLYGASGVWVKVGDYIVRSGHAWASIALQRVTMEAIVRPSDVERYASLHIPGADDASLNFDLPFEDWDALKRFWDDLEERQPFTLDVLAQGARAIRDNASALFGGDAVAMILSGFSENAHRTAKFMQSSYGSSNDEFSPYFDGYFPASYPSLPLKSEHAPIIQLVHEGDMADPNYAYRPELEGRKYRRPDADEAGDRYRLYELAGVAHVETRYAPLNDPMNCAASPLRLSPYPGTLTPETKMNSMPYRALVAAALQHLVEWVRHDVRPPRADRLEIDAGGLVAKDGFGNAIGGVRLPELDVPIATYRANMPDPDGGVSHALAGIDLPFDRETLQRLYGSDERYHELYRSRLEDLVRDGWVLAPEAEVLIQELSSPLSEHASTPADGD